MIAPIHQHKKRSLTALMISWVPMILIGAVMANEQMGFWYIPFVGCCLAPIPIWFVHRIKTKRMSILGATVEPFHEGEKGIVHVCCQNNNKDTIHDVQVGVWINKTFVADITYDIPAQTETSVCVTIASDTLKRGKHELQKVFLYTGFPFNLFTTSFEATFKQPFLVYPKLERNPPPFPLNMMHKKKARMGEDVIGMREYQAGDAMRTIDWKLSARQSNLVVREYEHSEDRNLAFSWDQVDLLGVEEGLQRLAAWIVLAEKHGKSYSLDLKGQQLGPSKGFTHMRQCMAMMALFGHDRKQE